MIAKIMQKSCC